MKDERVPSYCTPSATTRRAADRATGAALGKLAAIFAVGEESTGRHPALPSDTLESPEI